MRDEEPAVLAGRPPPPGLGQPRQVRPGGQAVLDGPVAERRFGQPFGPRRAPPRPVLGPGVTPGTGRGLDRGEAGLPGPGQQAPPRVRLAAERPGHVPVQRLPFGQPGVVGEPEETAVVPVARGDQPPGPAHPPHLGQRRDRVGQVLQHLVRVHHVERMVLVAQGVHVPDLEPDVGLTPPVRLLPRQRQHIAGRVDPGHLAVRDPGGQVRGDRAGAAAHVEHARVGRQSRQQVPG